MEQNSTKKGKEMKVLPLSETLRDLALLRASEVDLAGLLPPEAVQAAGHSGENDKGNQAVAASAEFIAEARKAIRMHDRGDVDGTSSQLDALRKQYEDLLEGIA